MIEVKRLILVMMMLIMITSAFAYIGHVYSEDLRPGKVGEIVVTFYNPNTYKEKLRMDAYIPELDARYQDTFKVRSQDSGRSHAFFEIPDDAESDYYPVIITLKDDEGNRVKKHSWVFVE